jgi:hypothetical protein
MDYWPVVVNSLLNTFGSCDDLGGKLNDSGNKPWAQECAIVDAIEKPSAS